MLVCWVAIGSLIQIKTGCFQQRIDLLQRFGYEAEWRSGVIRPVFNAA